MISYTSAIDLLLENSTKLPVATNDLKDCRNLVAAQTVTCKTKLPAFANSAMDGFAVKAADTASASLTQPVTLSVIGSIAAGNNPTTHSVEQTGTAWEIMTGAVIPNGYDAVVKIEDVRVQTASENNDTAIISITAPVPVNSNIRKSGEDFHPGDILINAGEIITPRHIMALAATGNTTIDTISKPTITILATGKELEHQHKQLPASGKINNSNTPYLLAELSNMPVIAKDGGIIADDAALFAEKLNTYLKSSNVIISTGAVSMGKYDFIPQTLQKLGAEIIFHKVAIRPGKPILYAKFSNGTHYFGLPGNPISAAVGLRFFVIPLLRHMQNMPTEQPLTARLLTAAPKKTGLHFFRKARVNVATGGKLQLEILAGQESFKIQPMLKANCWAMFTPEQTGTEIGEAIAIYPITPNRWEL